jgi:tRNA-2-methylthio-N6-dimethylallyladenosine synthase
MPKKLHIKTYGCQMNVYDSIRMAELLAPLGYEETPNAADADFVLLNTCHIREKAAEKVYSELGRIRETKEEWRKAGKRKLIGVAGCVAQAEGEEILARAPYVDIVVGPQSYQSLPELLEQTLREGNAALNLDFPEEPKFDALPAARGVQGVSAFVSVQEGCDKFCSFCVVPYTRGVEYSRPADAILDEVRACVAQGAVEITLLGQNVNAYHGIGENDAEWGLAKLIRAVAEIEGVQRIRYTTSHPRDMTDDLIAAHGEVAKLMPCLHLPVQSGSDRILKLMNRKHTAEQYLAIIEKLRRVRPEMVFSSDFIVGFPGETEADFEATLRLVETVHFAQAYAFTYSPRPGTPAADKKDQVPEKVKQERLQRLIALIQQQQLRTNRMSVGSVMPVLFDRTGKQAGQVLGKSPFMQSVYVKDGMEYAGKLLDVRILGGYLNSLEGEVVICHPEHREGSNFSTRSFAALSMT